MYTRIEQLSKRMANGGSRVSSCWRGRLQAMEAGVNGHVVKD